MTAPDPDTPVSATLDDIRVRVFTGDYDDAPSLLAAVEAVLKLADEWAEDSFIVDPEIALRNAIGRALAGEEAT